MEKLKNKRGDGYIAVCVTVVILCMLISVFITFATAVNTIRVSRQNARVVLDSFVMQNSIEIYDSAKNGNDFTESFDREKFISDFSEYNSLDLYGNMLYCCDADENEVYRQTLPTVYFTTDKKLKIQVRYTIILPIRFAGEIITYAPVSIAVDSKFNNKF